MQAFTSSTGAGSGIIGVEPMPAVTYSIGLSAAQGTLKAGTWIDAAGAKTATVANVHGLLAFDTTTDATAEIGATIYLSGSFHPQTNRGRERADCRRCGSGSHAQGQGNFLGARGRILK